MLGRVVPIGILLLASHVASQNVSFTLYPAVDEVSLALALNVTDDCLEALNTTLPCDPTLFQMASSVDNYWWEADNLTDLCTNACFSAVDAWSADVENRCVFDSLVAYGKVIPASSVADRFYDGFQIACLTPGNATDDSNLDTNYCLIESQDWVGSDIVRPDCTVNPTDPSCTDATNVSPENERLANLYGNDVLCSECFVQLMYQRLISPYLPDHDYSDYLIEQYQDILDVCNASNNMPELVIRAPPAYTDATPPPLNLSSFAPTTCVGQLILKSTLDPNANCQTISQAFNVPTGDVIAATGSANCTFSQSSICLPAPCTLKQVPTNASCESLTASFSTGNLTVTTVQFLNWNPNAIGVCDSLNVGQNICASAPGGSYVPPPPPAGSANDAGQQRGGGDGSTNSTLPPPPSCPGGIAPPEKAQAGYPCTCNKWVEQKTGVFCADMATAAGITLNQLYALNPGLNGDCSGLWAGYAYCVGPLPSLTATTTSAAPTGTCAGGTAPPEQTQPGIACNCNRWLEQKDGVFCADMATAVGISLNQLYALNPALNGDCSGLWAGYAYCVGPVPASSPTTAKTTSSTPTTSSTAPASTCAGGTAPPEQTQPGISCKCNNWVEQKSGVFCFDMAAAAGIPLQTLYNLNPALNGDCSGLWAGYAYCVGLAT